MMFSNVSIFIALTSTMFSTVYACSMPRGWRPKSLPERAKSAEIVLYGKVISSPSRWYFPVGERAPILKKKRGLYSAKVEVYCVFKGDVRQKFLNISGYGYVPGRCLVDHVIEGEKMVFFARFNPFGQLVPQNVNLQISAAIVDSATLLRVIKAAEMSGIKASVNNKSRRYNRPIGDCPMMTSLL